MTPDLLEEIRALDPAAAIAARGADPTARAATRAAARPGPTAVMPGPSRRWRPNAILAGNTAPVLAKAALAVAVLAGGTSFGVILAIIVRGPGVRPGLAVLGALGVLAGVPLGRHLGRSPVLAVLALWSVAGILAFTVIADLPLLHMTPVRWAWPGLRRVFYDPGWSDLTAWTIYPHGPLKVLLYLPAGLLLTALTRRPGRVVLALAALALAVDVTRAWATHTIGSNGNLIAETLGAVLGTALALLLPRITHHVRARPSKPSAEQ